MSRPNGWLLGVGGIEGTEVAPKNYPVVETSLKRRNIKLKGGIAERKSGRSSGLDVVALGIPRDSTSKELKLLQLGDVVANLEVKLTIGITSQVLCRLQ